MLKAYPENPRTLVLGSVKFHYDYRVNKASLLVRDGDGAVKKLIESIPGFLDALRAI